MRSRSRSPDFLTCIRRAGLSFATSLPHYLSFTTSVPQFLSFATSLPHYLSVATSLPHYHSFATSLPLFRHLSFANLSTSLSSPHYLQRGRSSARLSYNYICVLILVHLCSCKGGAPTRCSLSSPAKGACVDTVHALPHALPHTLRMPQSWPLSPPRQHTAREC